MVNIQNQSNDGSNLANNLNESSKSSQSSNFKENMNSLIVRNSQQNSSNESTIPNQLGNSISNCPICLSSVEDRALINSCSHEFCRPCIEQWSLDHNRCPVCRQQYSSIFHKFRTIIEYDTIEVGQPFQPSNQSNSGFLLIDGYLCLLLTPLDTGVYVINPRQTPHGILYYSILFLAQNQSFIFQNNMFVVRPENLNYFLSQLDERGMGYIDPHLESETMFSQTHYHNSRQRNCGQNNDK